MEVCRVILYWKNVESLIRRWILGNEHCFCFFSFGAIKLLTFYSSEEESLDCSEFSSFILLASKTLASFCLSFFFHICLLADSDFLLRFAFSRIFWTCEGITLPAPVVLPLLVAPVLLFSRGGMSLLFAYGSVSLQSARGEESWISACGGVSMFRAPRGNDKIFLVII